MPRVDSRCPRSPASRAYCKLDYLQRTGSFKERGARNALLELLSDQQRAAGVVAASAGNHALGLAYHGICWESRVTVVMPKFAPLIKITTCRRSGGPRHPARRHLRRRPARSPAPGRPSGSLTYIHGFDDPAIIAGQGTLGLEILEQVPDVEAIVVPIGGAGLIAGISLAVKSLRPECLIVGVEAARAASFTAALAAGQPVDVPVRSTLADGLAVGRVGNWRSRSLARGSIAW